MRPKRNGSGRDSIEVSPLGDSALIVRISRSFGDEKTLQKILTATSQLARAEISGVTDLVPAYTTIGIFFDPAKIGVEQLSQQIRETLRHSPRRRDKTIARSIDIPVCFDRDFALDLEHVAANAQLSEREVVDLYCAAEYRVACVGFTPGFPYLLGLPEKLTTPRRVKPRTDIPAGSVAIGGEQAGIYPLASPGGWNVIGRTSLRLFDPQNNPPALLRAGDRVRFRAVTRAELEGSTT